MQGPTDEASVPPTTTTTTTTSAMESRRLSGTMRRRIGKRTYPWPTAAAAEIPTLPPPPPPPPEDEDPPAAKKPRLQVPSITITSAAIGKDGAERVTTTDSRADDTPATVPVTPHTPAILLPRAGRVSHVPRRNWWKREEDAKLIEAVKKYGTVWVAVATMVPDRTNIQCHYRWNQSLDPDNKWTPEADTKLIEAVQKHGTDWVAVSTLVDDRTKHQCRQRWTQTLDPAVVKSAGKWTKEEDKELTEAMKKHGTHWVAVSALVDGRTNLQCRQRWAKTLDPAIEKSAGKWTQEEDTKLTKAVQKHGTAWVTVAALFRGRTNVNCRRRWTQTLDPNIGKSAGKWTKEEDTTLTEAVQKHGTAAWLAVAALVGRTNIQCRNRWVQAVGPGNGRKAGKWTPEEDTKLIEAVKKHGTHWVPVGALVHGRTDKQCRIRWTARLDPDRASNTVKEDPARPPKLACIP
jgi:3-keto-L-gulonate-6-phosphate decarboxylase